MNHVDARNVLGTALVPCSYDPLTGYYRAVATPTSTTKAAMWCAPKSRKPF